MENKMVAKGLQAIVTQLGQQADGHMIQSRIFAAAGFSKLADKYAEHATEERGYVSQCINRMIGLGIEAKLEAKPEGQVCTDPVEWVKYNLRASKDGLAGLGPIVEASRTDYATYDILKNYYEDEKEDLYWGGHSSSSSRRSASRTGSSSRSRRRSHDHCS